MTPRYALACDPSLCNFGCVIFRLDAGNLRPVQADVFETASRAAKDDLYVAEDDSRRNQYLASQVRGLLHSFRPVVVASEAYSQPRMAGAATKLMRPFGALDALVSEFEVPLLQASPQKISGALGIPHGIGRDAKKKATVAEIERRFPEFPWPPRTAVWEHAADAAGAAIACLLGTPEGQKILKGEN